MRNAKEYVGSGRLKEDASRTVDNVKSVFSGEDFIAKRKAEQKGKPTEEIVDVEPEDTVHEDDDKNGQI